MATWEDVKATNRQIPDLKHKEAVGGLDFASIRDFAAVQRAIDVKPDGIYGPMSATAVKEYQMSHGLSVDGIVGPSAWNTLF